MKKRMSANLRQEKMPEMPAHNWRFGASGGDSAAADNELLKSRNGGYPVNTCYPTNEKTSWADDHIEIETIYGIGIKNGIDNEYGNKYLIEEWEYPAIGIVICRCPSAGHDTVMLDYSECGKEGEPKVVHIDTETETGEPKVTVLAQDFAIFIKGLKPDTEFETTPEPLNWRATHRRRAAENQ